MDDNLGELAPHGDDAGPEPAPHPAGTAVALRSLKRIPRHGLAVSFAVAGIVLQDDAEFAVVATPSGSGRASRAGRRTGPRGRNIAVDDWDGSYDLAEWEGEAVVRVHPRGRCWSLWRWHDGRDWTSDWYGNLEAPWRRTPIGFDTRDWALDVVAEGRPGTPGWRVGFKDEDELAWFTEHGFFTAAEAARIRRAGDELAGLLRAGDGPAAMDWSPWVPPAVGPVPLPEEWASVHPERPAGR
ncbi:DUF402 domain-containing protein [Agromyces archimandritae]|uniref:DUF402 domain-containing protein n=1 Tax=Agromyces archimandritae TaxID=2781962 RepID=A0A975FQM4_9MICO|nr:DUF402 domain-containing protein [Agromyces archimandritae]QTX05923.1 DUF402 domain-containing protein [Agromyces archimandritae]